MHPIKATLGLLVLLTLLAAVLLWPRLGPASAATTVPPNDDFPGTTVGFLPFTDGPLSTAKATVEQGEPSPCGGIGKTVWYRFTATVDTSVQADTIISNYDTVLAVYTGPPSATSFSELTPVECNDDFFGQQSMVQFSATATTTYYVQAGGFNSATGNLRFSLAPPAPPPPPPPNDNFQGGEGAENLGPIHTLSTATATTEQGEPQPCGLIERTVWYKWQPVSNYPVVKVDTVESDYNTVVAVYTGPPPSPSTSFNDLQQVGCNDDWPGTKRDVQSTVQSKVEFSATAGQTYYIQVGGFDGSVGNLVFRLTIGEKPTPEPTPCPTPKVPFNGGCGTPTNTPPPTPTATWTPKPTAKPSPTPKATPTPDPNANGSLRVDADCENPSKPPNVESVQADRTLLVGQTFHVCVVAQFPTPSAAGYQAKVHWGEDVLDINQRSAGVNDLWHLQGPQSCGPPNSASVSQVKGPPDDKVGSDAYLRLRSVDFLSEDADCAYTGPVSQFEFVCQSHGAANIELRSPGASDGSIFLSGASEIRPTLASVVIICVDPNLDSDVDGCTNAQELGPIYGLGGQRNPLNFWDFFDTPNPNVKPMRNRAVSVGDIIQVVQRFGATGNPNGNPLLRPPKAGYDTAYDRTPPPSAAQELDPSKREPWDLGPPNGSITVQDILLVVSQFGTSCIQPPPP